MKKKSLIVTFTLIGAFFSGGAAAASGQDLGTLDLDLRLGGKELRKAFQPVQDVLNKHSVAIYSGANASLYGTIVSDNGYFLTKASDFLALDEVSLRVGRERIREFSVVAYDEDWDLLLVKIEAENLDPIVCAKGADLSHGTWVVSNGGTTRRERRVRVGIISANSRVIKGTNMVALGVNIKGKVTEKGLEVGKVVEKSGAKRAGIQEGDFILKIGDFEIKQAADLKDALTGHKPGTFLDIEISRKSEVMVLPVELLSRKELFDEKERRGKNDALSGRVSKRRYFFPKAIQHATLMSIKNVGGPLLNLDGECVGMNIANANRSENFAIPAVELEKLIEKLRKEAKANGNVPMRPTMDSKEEDELSEEA